MTEYLLRDTDNHNERTFDSKEEAEKEAEALRELGASVEIQQLGSDGGSEADIEAEIVDHAENGHEEPNAEDTAAADTENNLQSNDQTAMDVATASMADPLETLPGWMRTEVSYSDYGDSSYTINKRGCQVIADYLDLQIDIEPLTTVEDSDWEYSYYKAIAKDTDGNEYVGHGVARADGNDQPEDAGWKLEMLAETRAFKRAVKLATGGGIRAFVEANQ